MFGKWYVSTSEIKCIYSSFIGYIIRNHTPTGATVVLLVNATVVVAPHEQNSAGQSGGIELHVAVQKKSVARGSTAMHVC
jgi:ribosomal protein S7